MRQIVLFLFLAVLPICIHAATHTDNKASADSLYAQCKYKEAADAYNAIITTKGEVADLYYNLGNCYYKLGDIPHAILNYERALLLDPSDEDTRANLTLARSKTTDKVTPSSEMFFVTWWRELCNSMSIDGWKTMGIVTFILTLLGCLFYLFFHATIVRKIGFYCALLLLIVTIVSNLCAYTQHQTITQRNAAIITTPVVTVKSSPDPSSTQLFVIHEGSRVQLMGNVTGEWSEILFEEGKQGWVPTTSFEIIEELNFTIIQ